MTALTRPLTIDEAIGQFQAMVVEELGEAAPGACGPPLETPAEADSRHFLLAQYLIGLACPVPARCRDRQCRRDICRHLARVRTRWSARKSSHPRRPPGADALRYAIWVYVSARRGGG